MVKKIPKTTIRVKLMLIQGKVHAMFGYFEESDVNIGVTDKIPNLQQYKRLLKPKEEINEFIKLPMDVVLKIQNDYISKLLKEIKDD